MPNQLGKELIQANGLKIKQLNYGLKVIKIKKFGLM